MENDKWFIDMNKIKHVRLIDLNDPEDMAFMETEKIIKDLGKRNIYIEVAKTFFKSLFKNKSKDEMYRLMERMDK